MEADGVGPSYCKACKKARNDKTECDSCPRPGVLPENVQAIEIFSNCITQWRYSGLGKRTGLDYTSVDTLMNLYSVEDKRDCFERIQILESELITVDNDDSEINGQQER